MIPRLTAGVPQLVTYALDSKIEIKHEVPEANDEKALPSTWEFEEDRMIERLKFQRKHFYRIQNEGKEIQTLFIEHDGDEGEWIPEPSDAWVATQSQTVHRYCIRVPAVQSITLEVSEMKVGVIRWNNGSSIEDMRNALRRPDLTAQARARLELLLRKKTETEAVVQRTLYLTRVLDEIAKDQTRIKGLMSALVRGDTLHTRYLGKLDELENQMELAQTELASLRSK